MSGSKKVFIEIKVWRIKQYDCSMVLDINFRSKAWRNNGKLNLGISFVWIDVLWSKIYLMLKIKLYGKNKFHLQSDFEVIFRQFHSNSYCFHSPWIYWKLSSNQHLFLHWCNGNGKKVTHYRGSIKSKRYLDWFSTHLYGKYIYKAS